ncbi:hypothetical protein G6F46_014419 [Rhizopus delemar]|nr:hypothetical protein G6F46_014419 [Rhizopus delemar]
MTVAVAGETLILPLAYVLEALQPQAEDIRSMPGEGRVLRVRESHQELIDALQTRDPDKCEAAMRQHVLNTVPALQAFLEQAA